MDPNTALERQLDAYRRMTGEERLAIGLRLHELSCEIARAGIRAQHPGANPEQVEQLLHVRLKLAQVLSI
jgi:type II secretory pathway predicted ATPase ExeA